MSKTKEEIEKDELEAKNKAEKESFEAKQKQNEVSEKAIKENQKDSIVPKTETTAKEDARAEKLLSDPAGAETTEGLDLGTFATSTGFTHDEHKRAYHPNDVKFNVTNPKDSGMPKGIVIVSKETADLYDKAGYGKVVK